MPISSSERTYFHSPNFESPSSMSGIGNPHIHSIGVLYTGTTGNDSQTGTSGDDGFDYSQGGNDTLNGLDGADEFTFGATFNYQDNVDGGAGYDTLFLDGDYGGSAFQWSNTTLANVEEIDLAAGNNYILYTSDGTVAAGQRLFIDASALDSVNTLFLDGSFESDGSFLVHGGAGGDTLLVGGGTDHIFGNGGNDLVFFDTHFTADDQVDGGDGFDTVAMTVAAPQTLMLTLTTMRNVESLVASAAENAGVVQLTLTTVDDTVLSGDTLAVSHIVRPNSSLQLYFDGSAETNGHFDITGGSSDDTLLGGARSDIFRFEDGGIDAGVGGGGKDTMFAGATLSPDDVFQGGGGFDTLDLSGDYAAGVTFQSTTMTGIERIVVHAGNDYLLALDPLNVPNGALAIDGSALGSDDTLTIYGAAIDGGKLVITGGGGADFFIGGTRGDDFRGSGGADTLSGNNGNDTLTGGAGNDSLFGAEGRDTIIGGNGRDVFHYLGVNESTGAGHDVVTGFDANGDQFALDVPVNGIDVEVTSGRLRGPSFDSDLASAIGSGELAKHHAVLFTPSAGAFAGQTLLIVDANGTRGYQAGEDYVFALSGAVHLNSLDPGDFI